MAKIITFTNSNHDYYYYQSTSDRCNVEVHLHDSYEIYQACTDNIRYFVDGNAYDLAIGDLIITNQKELHRPITTNSSPYGRRFIQFNPIAFTTFFDSGYNPLSIFDNRPLGINNHIALNKQQLVAINERLDSINRYSPCDTPQDTLIFKTLILQLLLDIDTIYKESNQSIDFAFKMDPRITTVKKYLDQNYHLPFTLDHISKEHFIDKYYLSHLFKSNTGFTLLEYIQSKRIQKAKQLIHKGVSFTEISRLCGYNDYSNFYKAFIKLVKVSPKTYKAQSAHD